MSNKRAALYVRVSTDAQTVENQIRELRQVAGRRGWHVVEVYSDAGISGAKGRNGRPGLDTMLKDASRRKFDIVMAWAIDRLGRSLSDLLDTIQHLEACGVDLYLDQQAIDTTTPMGKLVFQLTGAFAEFERTMIRQRIKAGLKRAVAQGVKLGRPKIDGATERKVRRQLAKGIGILKVARSLGIGTGTVQRISGERVMSLRGGAMSKGERPQALGQSLQKSFATRWAPLGGTFVLGISLMPPLPKTCPKMVSAPQKGVAFLTEDVFEKRFSVAGKDSAVGASASA
jgi:DNA invertase Pin-like site-specific DNA recombinase